MIDTPLQMARRQVRRGRILIVQQQALIDDMIAHGDLILMPQARIVMAALQKSQRLREEHLARLEREDRKRLGETC